MKTQKLKKGIYLILSVILGILLSIIIHAGVEIFYLKYFFNSSFSPKVNGACFLPPGLSLFFLLGGALGGYFLGRVWWRIVYIEKRHWRMKNK